MTTSQFVSTRIHYSKLVGTLLLLSTLVAGLARADSFDPPTGNLEVVYNPDTTQSVQGEQPLHYTYTLNITSPGALTSSATIAMTAVVLSAPEGVSTETAAGFIKFSPATIVFSGPNESRTVTVSLDVPVGGPTGSFAYKILTSGWNSSLGIIDNGTFVNMHASPPSGLPPPTVTIHSPVDETIYQHVIGGAAVSVPVEIAADATQSAPVLTLVAALSGTTDAGATISPTPIAITSYGLGTPHVDSSASLAISVAGRYTITTTATNINGESTATVDFVVVDYVAGPTVVIDPPANNPTYSYVRGLTSVTVPYTITGYSAVSGVRSLTGSLDGNAITNATVVGVGPAGVGQLKATAAGSFTYSAATLNGVGQHTIDATVVDDNGNASTSAVFTVVELVPTIETNIANPLDGASIPLPPDASPLNIPYNFTTTTTYNAPITAISATLTPSGGDLQSLTLDSMSGLGTATASGGGTLLNVAAGAYTLGATGSNLGLSLTSFDSVHFTVTPPPPPSIVFTQSPAASYTVLTGYTETIPVAILTTSVGTTTNPGPAYISTQSLTLDGQPISLATNTANGTAFSATGTASITVSAPAAGTSETHVLSATGTDAYGQITTTQVSFVVVGKEPVITIAINPEVAGNSPYTIPTVGGSVSIPFTFTGNITEGATVDTITGSLAGSAVTITSYTGLGTSSVATGSGVLTISTPGTYTLTATDTNTKSGISATTSVQFVVKACQTIPPLTVTITEPPLPSYTLPNRCSTLSIPITFVGLSNNGNWGGYVSTLSATLDGRAVSLSSVSNLGKPTATAKATLSVNKTGTHTLVVKATDKWSQTATASVTFVVVVQTPVINVVIDTPSNNSTYVLPGGSCGCGSTSSLSIPFTFTSTITAGSTIDSISALLNGCSVSVTSSGLGTATAKGSGTLTVKKAGTYTLTAKAYDRTAGISATTSITFTVRAPNPPTVVITKPTEKSYTLACGSTLSVPFVFNAISDTTGGITKLSATLDGCRVNVTSAGLNTATATGSGTLAVKTAGSHKLTVTATDSAGCATASFTFTVTTVQASKYTINGTVFFDINFNGSMDGDDYGLPNVKVTLYDSTGYGLSTMTTDSAGKYAFSVPAGTYMVHVADVNGMSLTTLNDNSVKVTTSAVTAPNVGYGLKFSSIRGMCANGYTIGYWKNNGDKALAGKTKGCQVSASDMRTYTSRMGSLSLEPFGGISLSTACYTMGSTSSSPASLLSKQLIASEYNYLSGAYIGGDSRLTHAFITYAESVLKRQSSYSSSYLLFVKDWCDAYNNSHGGLVRGPLN